MFSPAGETSHRLPVLYLRMSIRSATLMRPSRYVRDLEAAGRRGSVAMRNTHVDTGRVNKMSPDGVTDVNMSHRRAQ